MSKVFWREKELTKFEEDLLNYCFEAHHNSARRNNISTNVLVNASKGSLNYTTALAAALNTLGGVHAPITQTVNVMFSSMEEIEAAIEQGAKIPGWGHDFVQGEIDPHWVKVNQHLENHFPKVHERIAGITKLFHDRGKMIYPNPSAFTAAVGMALSLPAPIIPYLFIQGRLPTWTAMFYQTMVEQAPKPKQKPQPTEKEAA